MPSIQIDEDVFAVLQKNAKPFVDSPNSALRRLLGIETLPIASRAASVGDELEQLLKESLEGHRTRTPKADLQALVGAGLLREGERLFLVDYQGQKVAQHEAAVAGSLLAFKAKHYTMSNLAQELLKKIGFKSNSVRGPSHWVNAKGVSVTALWQQLLNQRVTK